VLLLLLLLSPLKPSEFPQPQLDDDAIRAAVAEQVARFAARLNSFGRDVLCVKFFETRTVKRLLGYETEEKLCWEQWYIPVRLVPAAAGSAGGVGAGGLAAAAERQRCARNVSQRLQQIVDVVNNPKHYIPLLTSNLKVPFPYEIAPLKNELVAPPVATGAATGGGGIGDLWNLVSGATMK